MLATYSAHLFALDWNIIIIFCGVQVMELLVVLFFRPLSLHSFDRSVTNQYDLKQVKAQAKVNLVQLS
jgi:hypothetical protein